MSDEYPVTILPIKFAVTCVPGDRHFTVYAERRSLDPHLDTWVVTQGFGDVLSRSNGKFEYGYPYSTDDPEWSREGQDAWRENHRWTLAEAIAKAEELAPQVTVNGCTVTDGLRMKAEREEAGDV